MDFCGDRPGAELDAAAAQAAWQWAASNDRAARDAILTALRGRIAAGEAAVQSGEVEDQPWLVPGWQALPDDAALAAGMTLTAVHILPVAAAGVCYTGYTFRCSWEPDDELGALLWQDRVVELGDGFTALLCWLAEDDRARQVAG